MGSCWIPLGGNNHRDAWFPMSMVQSYAFSEAGLSTLFLVFTLDVFTNFRSGLSL